MEFRRIAHCDFVKFDARSGAFVGVATSETPDEDGEVIDLDASQPYFAAWSASCHKRSGGKSYGNIREMHGATAVGKLTAPPLFDMVKRRVIVQGMLVDPTAHRKAAEGVYTGLSIGGRYVKRSRHPTIPGMKVYVADPIEVSVVDVPNNPDAEMQLVDAGGATKLLKFKRAVVLVEPALDDVLMKAARLVVAHGASPRAITRRVGGLDLASDAFAYVGDPENPSTWKYAMHDGAHVRSALARWGQEKGIPATAIETVYGRLKSAAEKFGVELSVEAEKLIKGLYEAGGLAACLQNLEESRRTLAGDGSAIPERIRKVMVHLASVLKDVAAEEVDALLAQSATTLED